MYTYDDIEDDNPYGFIEYNTPFGYVDPKYLNGGGIIDTIKNTINRITDTTEYAGEKHIPGYSFAGPGTRLELRRRDNKMQPINHLDSVSKQHDLDYENIGNKYKKGEITKDDALSEIWNSDQKFIDMLESDDNKMSKIAATMINMKMKAEKNKILPTKTFSGIGCEQEEVKRKPNENLKKFSELLQKENNKKKSSKKKSSKKKIRGGLGPILVGIIASIGSAVVDHLLKKYKIMDKIMGNGNTINKLNLQQKKDILLQHIEETNDKNIINDLIKFQ